MKKYIILIITICSVVPFSFVTAQEPTEPLIENEVEQGLGGGTFPDVAWGGNQLWLAVQQSGELQIYRSGPNGQNLAIYRTIPTGGGQAFPRMAVRNGVIWIVFRDASQGEQIRLWRSDTEAIESLGVGYGNSPAVINSSTVAWQSDSRYQISARALTGGTVSTIGRGAPTGLSRLTSSRGAVTIDRDRNLYSWGTKPAFAGPLIVVEASQGGLILTFGGQAQPQTTIQNGVANDPRAAYGPSNLFAVASWAAGGSVRVTTFTSTAGAGFISEDTDPPPGADFRDNFNIPVPVTEMNFGQFLQLIINYSFYILGIVVFVMVFWAGFIWFTAAGDPGKVTQAKGRIYNAIIGTILLVASYAILNTINPDLISGNFNLDPIGSNTNPDTGPGTNPILPPGTIPPGVNPPTVTLANLGSVVSAYAAQNPTQLAQSCDTTYGPTSWQFMDGVVAALRAADPRVGYNGRRGNTNDPSEDAISYYFGAMPPTEGSRDVYIVDVISNHCGASPGAVWQDVTPATWQGGTTGAWIRNR